MKKIMTAGDCGVIVQKDFLETVAALQIFCKIKRRGFRADEFKIAKTMNIVPAKRYLQNIKKRQKSELIIIESGSGEVIVFCPMRIHILLLQNKKIHFQEISCREGSKYL